LFDALQSVSRPNSSPMLNGSHLLMVKLREALISVRC